MSKKTLSSVMNLLKSKKVVLLILVIIVIGIAPTRAQTTGVPTDQGLLGGISYFLGKITKLFSRVRIILAMLAGKLMTNDLVYGSWFHLDQYLRQIRNIAKNFANFGLLGFLLRSIIKSSGKLAGEIQGIIKKTLIAGILIQASWFLTGAMLDVSTVATSAVGGIASSFINTSTTATTIKKAIDISGKKNMIGAIMEVDEKGNVKVKENKDSNIDPNKIIDYIMPKADSLAGPLIMIGASSLRVQDLITIDTNAYEAKDVIINFGLKAMMLILYVATLILMIIANFMRIGFLRVVIAISPLLILFWAFKGGKEDMLGTKGKDFSLGVIISYIFKPVIFMGILSLILIFTATINELLTKDVGKGIEMNGVTITANGGNGTIDTAAGSFTLHDAIFVAENESKSALVMTIIYFLTIFMLRALVKEGVKLGGGTIGETVGKMAEYMENAAKTTQFIPIGGKNLSLTQLGSATGTMMDMPNKIKDNMFKEQNDATDKKLRGLFGLDSKEEETQKIAESKTASEFFTRTSKIIDGESEFKVGKNTAWQQGFSTWASDHESEFKQIFGGKNDFTNFDEFLNNKDKGNTENRKILYERLTGTKPDDTIRTKDAFLEADLKKRTANETPTTP